MSETVYLPSKDREALTKSERVDSQNGQHAMYGAPPGPPPPYYTASGPAGDAGYASGNVQPVVVVQPFSGVQYVAPAVAEQMVPDHLVYAIMATICCCWPIGLFAIFKSIECRSAINRGDVNTAMHLSRQTRRLANWTIGVGIVSCVLSVLIMGVYLWLTISHNMHMN